MAREIYYTDSGEEKRFGEWLKEKYSGFRGTLEEFNNYVGVGKLDTYFSDGHASARIPNSKNFKKIIGRFGVPESDFRIYHARISTEQENDLKRRIGDEAIKQGRKNISTSFVQTFPGGAALYCRYGRSDGMKALVEDIVNLDPKKYKGFEYTKHEKADSLRVPPKRREMDIICDSLLELVNDEGKFPRGYLTKIHERLEKAGFYRSKGSLYKHIKIVWNGKPDAKNIPDSENLSGSEARELSPFELRGKIKELWENRAYKTTGLSLDDFFEQVIGGLQRDTLNLDSL